MDDLSDEATDEATDQPTDEPKDDLSGAPMDLIADGAERGVSRRQITVDRIVGAIVGAFMLGGAAIGALILHIVLDPPWEWLARLPVLAALPYVALTQWWPAYSHPFTRWRLDGAALRIRRGVLWRQEIDVPLSRVQHTDVVQGPLERRFGVAKLVVHTAGTVDATVVLGGLEVGVARAVRDHLVRGDDDAAV